MKVDNALVKVDDAFVKDDDERECCLLVLNLVSSTLLPSNICHMMIKSERECCLLVLNLVSSTLSCICER